VLNEAAAIARNVAMAERLALSGADQFTIST
jgi:hypothetical protein